MMMSKVFCSNRECFFFSNPLPSDVKVCLYCQSPVKQDDTDSAQSKSDGVQWYEEAFETFPCVLAHEYKRLYDLYQQGKMYGVLVQIRDVMEATIKFLVLTSSAWGIKHIDSEERELGYETDLLKEKTFGQWKAMLEKVRSFYNPTNRNVGFPSCLYELIKDVPSWEGKNHLIEWRNTYIGHGALGFEDDPSFRENVKAMINAITKFYQSHRIQFSKIQVLSDGFVLHGFQGARNLEKQEGVCKISIEGEEPFDCSQFIIHDDHGIYFFDKKEDEITYSHLLSYPMGRFKMKPCDYITRLAGKYRGNEVKEASAISPFMSNIESDLLSRLGCKGVSVEPHYITDWLNSMVTKHKSGIFMLEMERGYGKSFYTEKLNSRFGNPWIIADDLDVRTYHLSRTQLGGISEFVDGVSYEWNESYGNHARIPIMLAADYSAIENNAKNMIVYLKQCKERSNSANYYYKQRVMLVLDGLDEIGEENADIWSFIPKPEELPEGVYILLTGRLVGTDTLPEKFIEKRNMLQLTEESLKVSSHLKEGHIEENKQLLADYIRFRKINLRGNNTEEKLIAKAEYKILNLSMWCDILNQNPEFDLDDEENDTVVNIYLDMLETAYGEKKTCEFRRLLLYLAELGHYEPLSIEEMADLINYGSIQFELLGMLSDLAPILRIDRALQYRGGQLSDSNRFALVHDDFEKAIMLRLSLQGLNAGEELLGNVSENICGEEPYAVKGASVVLSHIAEIQDDLNTKLSWDKDKLEHVYSFIHRYLLSNNSLLGWIRYRDSVAQIKAAWDSLVRKSQKVACLDVVIDAMFEETSSTDDINKLWNELFLRIHELKKMHDLCLDNYGKVCIRSAIKINILLADYYGMIHQVEEQAVHYEEAVMVTQFLDLSNNDDAETYCILYSKMSSFYGGIMYRKAKENKDLSKAEKHSQKAVDYIRKAIETREALGHDDEMGDYSLFENYISLADYLDDLGNHEEAKRIYDKYIPLIEEKLDPDNPKGINTLWHAYINYILACKDKDYSPDMLIRIIRKNELYKDSCVDALLVKNGVYQYAQDTIRDMKLYVDIYKKQESEEIKEFVEKRIKEIDLRLACLPNVGEYMYLKIDYYGAVGNIIYVVHSRLDPVYYVNKGIALLEDYSQYNVLPSEFGNIIGGMYFRSIMYTYEHEGASSDKLEERIEKAIYWLKQAPPSSDTVNMINALEEYRTISSLF